MVPSLNGPAGGLSTPSAQNRRGNKAISKLQLPTDTRVTSPIGCLEGFRQRFRTGKISEQDIEL